MKLKIKKITKTHVEVSNLKFIKLIAYHDRGKFKLKSNKRIKKEDRKEVKNKETKRRRMMD